MPNDNNILPEEISINQQVRGVRIMHGEEAKARRMLLNGLILLAEDFGCSELILPSIEPTAIYTDKAGNEIKNQMYIFQDQGERSICLRPEGTATVQLIADKYLNGRGKDQKFWYFERCYRYERPQEGRYREFWQFGVEVINPSKEIDCKGLLMQLSTRMVHLATDNYVLLPNVKRGLNYYTEDGFEIIVDKLGAQKQVCGGGRYKQGIGFALGFDRLILCLKKDIAPLTPVESK